MQNAPFDLGGAGRIDAVISHFPFRFIYGPAARGAGGRRENLFFPQMFHYFDDFGNDFPRAFQNNFVPYAQAQAFDFVKVVQGRIGNDHARTGYRLHLRHGRNYAGASHGKQHIAHGRGGLFGRVFKRNGPARAFGGVAQNALLRKIVYFNNQSVRIKGQVVSFFVKVVVKPNHFVQRRSLQAHGRNVKAPFLTVVNKPAEAAGVYAAGTERMGKKLQRTLCGNGRIFLTQRSRGGIARVGKNNLVGGGLFLI